jgi:hypothetical protein
MGTKQIWIAMLLVLVSAVCVAAEVQETGTSGDPVVILDGQWAVNGYDAHAFAVTQENQDIYVTAKANGDWDKAIQFSPLTYVKGWMALNKAREAKYEAWEPKNEEGLKAARVLYSEAREWGVKAMAVEDPRGRSYTQKSINDGKAIVAQCDENIDKINAYLAEKPKAKKVKKNVEVKE